MLGNVVMSGTAPRRPRLARIGAGGAGTVASSVCATDSLVWVHCSYWSEFSDCSTTAKFHNCTHPEQLVTIPVHGVPIGNVEPNLVLLRSELGVHVEAVRAHEVAELDGLLGRRAMGLGARVLDEGVGLRHTQLVRCVGVEVLQDLN